MSQAVAYCACILLTILVSVQSGTPEENRKMAEDYLRKYEYLDSSMAKHLAELSETNDTFQMAVKSFQRMAGLAMTGELTSATMDMMAMPRCGIADLTSMGSISRRRRRYVAQGSKWPKQEITYSFSNFTPDLSNETVKRDIEKAFRMWSEVTPLEIYESSSKPDIQILFSEFGHGDQYPFDGVGRVLAHAYYPTFGGNIHFDESETFTSESFNGTNLLQVAVHELGHSLGLGHSAIKEAIMAPFYTGYKPDLKLHADDIEGIQYLYGPPSLPTATSRSTPIRDDSQRTTARILNKEWCDDATFDAIVSIDRIVYAFKGSKYAQLVSRMGMVPGYPRSISDTFTDLPSNLDAAMLWSQNLANILPNNKTGSVFFFKGTWCWLYISRGNDTFNVVEDYPMKISAVFDGVPDDLNAAFIWTGNGNPYFVKDQKYYRFTRGNKIDPGYPRQLRAWKGLPESIDSAFNWQENRRTYFFKDDKFYRFNDREFKVDEGYPQFTKDVWLGCSAINYMDREMAEGPDQFLLAAASYTRHMTAAWTAFIVIFGCLISSIQ